MSGRFTLLACVAIGSSLGASLRLFLSDLQLGLGIDGFPWATLAANVLGSFLMGLLAHITLPDTRPWATEPLRQFLLTGFCGGFTTFSLFSLETFALISAEHWLTAAVYMTATLALGVAAAAAGWRLVGHSPA